MIAPECKRLCKFCVLGKIVPIKRDHEWQLGEVRELTSSDKHIVEFPDGVREDVAIATTPFSDYLEHHSKKRPHESCSYMSEGQYDGIFDNLLDNLSDPFLPSSSPLVTKRSRMEIPCSWENMDILPELHPADWVLDCDVFANKLNPLDEAPLDKLVNYEDYFHDSSTATVTPLWVTPARSATKAQTRTPDCSPGQSDSNRNTTDQEIARIQSRTTIGSSPLFSSPNRSTPRRRRDGTPRKALPKIWTTKEDCRLTQLVQSSAQPTKWSDIALLMEDRTGKQCRERYLNHLTPKLRVEEWSPQEDFVLCNLFVRVGSKWALMAKVLKGRTDNNIKNRFHHIRRRLEKDVSRIIRNRDIDEVAGLINMHANFCSSIRSEANGDFAIKVHQILPYLAAETVREKVNQGKCASFVEVDGITCERCNLVVPSVQTGRLLSRQTGWCESCMKVPVYVVGDMLRRCLSLRKHVQKSGFDLHRTHWDSID